MVSVAGNGTNKGRGTGGRFTPGNPGGPGRPPRPTEERYRAVLLGSVSLEAWRAVVERAVTDAQNGDAAARGWLAKYLLGDQHMPAAVVQARTLTNVDQGELAEKAGKLIRGTAARRSCWSKYQRSAYEQAAQLAEVETELPEVGRLK